MKKQIDVKKITKPLLLFIFFIFTLIVGELILSRTNKKYQSWHVKRSWYSRLKESNENQTIELKGHWHLSRSDSKRKTLIDDLLTIDFENDTIAILGKYQEGGYGIGGYHDSENKSIRFGGECFAADFSYTIEGDELKLIQEDYYDGLDYFLAKKCDSECCDKQEDFFYGLDIEIDLPILDKEQCFRPEYFVLENRLYVGMPKENLRDDYGVDFKLVLNNKFSGIEDLELWEEKHKIKLPESKRSSIRKVIYADKDTPMQDIIPLLDYFKDKKEKNLFCALRKEDIRDGVKICLQRIDMNSSSSDINENEKLSSWLTK